MDFDKTKLAVDIFNKYAEDYQAKFGDVAQYSLSLDVLLENFSTQNANVLEIACGPGNVTQYLLQRRPDLQILGTDLAPKMLDLARESNPTASFKLMDGRAIGQLTEQFHAIVCGFFLPYLSKEEAIQFIADASKRLHAGGMLYLSTMEDDYQKSGWRKGSQGDEMYQHYHEAAYLTNAMLAGGLEILQLERQPYPSAEEVLTTDLLIVARKQ